jgi:hypothetical protein
MIAIGIAAYRNRPLAAGRHTRMLCFDMQEKLAGTKSAS